MTSKTLQDLLALLSQHNIRLALEKTEQGEQLKIRAAKGALTPEIKKQLQENKPELMRWIATKQEQQQQNQPIPARTVKLDETTGKEHLPLSFAQQRLWFIDQFDPGNPAYTIPAASYIHGPLDATILEQSLHYVVERHESLRTSFHTHNGEAYQRIHPMSEACKPRLLQESHEALNEQAIQALAQSHANEGFVLSELPLIRVKLIKISSEKHVLLLNQHHIISDGWSNGILLNDIAQTYTDLSQNQPVSLVPLPIQYGDYALWQQEQLPPAKLAEKVSYWQQKLADVPLLELTPDRPRPAKRLGQGASHTLTIDAQTGSALKQLAQQQGATLFNTLMAGFKALLYRYTGQTDLCVGTPVAGRNRSEVAPLIGFFVNTLALRSHINSNGSFTELLQLEKDNWLEASTHQDVPFESVVEALGLERDMSHSPVFQAMLVLQQANAIQSDAKPKDALDHFRFEGITTDSGTAKFDLTFNISENDDDALIVTIEYASDIYNSDSIERMAEHYKRLLSSAANTPEASIATLAMLPLSEIEQIQHHWNQTQSQYPRSQSLASLFEQQVKLTPDAIALDFGAQHISYKTLDEKANQLASFIQEQGVQPNDKVALCFDRSVEFIIAVLAVIKNHAAYVPLDAAYPDDRLEYMLQDTASKLLISESRKQNRLSSLSVPQSLYLDQIQDTLAHYSTEWTSLDLGDHAEQLAYIMYTSGSTGKPKGVMIPQRGITRLVKNASYFELNSDHPNEDGFAHISNISFDAATFEIWGSLLNGGRLVGIDKETLLSASNFKQVLIDKRVSSMFITVTLFNLFVSEDANFFASVRNCLVGGEALDTNKIKSVLECYQQHGNTHGRIMNGYGPTENTTFTCSYAISLQDLNRPSVPLGYPLTNTTAYILDERMQPVPIGVAGELYTGGDGVALGYLNLPEQTEQKFIADPFSQNPHAKLYRTGDVARYLNDGKIDMLGRIDDQIKMRGFRIELGEIEHTISSLPEVKECAVLVKQNTDSEGKATQSSASQYLAAYLILDTSSEGQSIDDIQKLSTIKAQLSEQLPQFMQPSAFVLMDTFPFTANGKLDKRALPEPTTEDMVSNEFVAPNTDTEKTIAKIWQSVLSVDKVGIHDNFFELGGHSLLATRVITQLKEQYQIDIPLRLLFDAPTVFDMAKLADSNKNQNKLSAITKVADVDFPQGYPLSYSQQRLWLIDQLQPGTPTYHIPFGVRIKGNIDIAATEAAIASIVKRHDSLRTCFVQVDGSDEPRQQVTPFEGWTLPQFELENNADALKQRVGAFFMAPFDLAQGSLFRAQLIKLTEHQQSTNESILIVCMHHIISDGWSMDVLLHEFNHFYTAFKQNPQAIGQLDIGSSLPALNIQYTDFSVWQRNWLQGDNLNAQLSYWQKQLANPPVLELPTDYPRPHQLDIGGKVIHFELDKQLTQKLNAVSSSHKATLYMTLMAAFQLLLSRYSGQDDICIGSPIANRNHASTEPLIGFFVNTLVMRSKINYNMSFQQLLAEVKHTALSAYAHQDIPFERLVDTLNIPREISQTPLFQAMFMLQNMEQNPSLAEETQLGDLTLSSLDSELDDKDSAAKFDLSLSMTERQGSLVGALEYRTALFKPETMQRMVGHFIRLLESIVDSPQQAVGTLAFMNETETDVLLNQWNQTHAPVTAIENNLTLPQLFEAQVERNPDALAIFGEQPLSYSELNRQANQLAHHLMAQGIQSGDKIGVLLPASSQAMIAIFAVLKAGATYIPMDVNYPADRLQHMIDNANMQCLITLTDLASRIPNTVKTCVLDDASTAWLECSTENPVTQGSIEDTLYVVYTSGSTGLPKGAGVTHKNALNLLDWYTKEYEMSEADRTLVMSALGFDLTQKNLFALLTTGGSIGFTQSAIYDPDHIRALIEQHNVSLLNCAPSAFYPLLDGTNFSALNSLRCVLFGGEPIQLDKLAPWLQSQGDSLSCQIINMYGPTECTDIAASYRLTSEDLSRFEQGQLSTLPIGKPNANVQLYVLDPNFQQPTPMGVPGELCIGGSGVGIGYVNNTELTEQAFIETQWGRLYRTGDLVRYDESSNLHFLSRIDGQVKIRGFRVELGEIEAKLKAHHQVHDAVVADKRTANGQVVLVAYLVMNESAATDDKANPVLDTAGLKATLKAHLPDYMVPQAYQTIDNVPLTPNGKIDRKSLPTPSAGDFGQANYQAPETQTEEVLAEIWASVLQADKISRTEQFFEAGGHSLLATKLVTRIKTQWPIELALTAVFEYPILHEQAAYIDGLLWAVEGLESDANTESGNPLAEDDDREEFEF